MYFDKNLNEFKLGNSRIPKTKIPPHPGLADVKQILEFPRQIPEFPKQKSRIPKAKSRIP